MLIYRYNDIYKLSLISPTPNTGVYVYVSNLSVVNKGLGSITTARTRLYYVARPLWYTP